MGGWVGKYVRLRGVAESIHYATAGTVEREARSVVRRDKPALGDVYVTGAYNLQAKWVVHAVTMMKPGSSSSIRVVNCCLDNVVTTCRQLEVGTVALPLLGTGTGRVSVSSVRALYEAKLSSVTDIDFIVAKK